MTSKDELAPVRLSKKPTWLLSQASIEAHRLLSDALAEVGARGYHYRLLAALDEFGPASQAALGRRISMDRSDVVAALNELAASGFVQRAADLRDGRRNVVTITAVGRDRLEQLEAVLARVQDNLLNPLTRRERQQLTQMLTRLLTPQAARAR